MYINKLNIEDCCLFKQNVVFLPEGVVRHHATQLGSIVNKVARVFFVQTFQKYNK
jgi:hypothetical protein